MSTARNGRIIDCADAGQVLKCSLSEAIRDAERLDRDATHLLERRGGHQPAPEPRYVLTQRGSDYLARERAMEALFGPWPTAQQAFAEARRHDA